MKYIVYITINLCNGKFYIGVHKTNPDVFDGYIGCGIYTNTHVKSNLKGLHSAVQKYGYNNFKRTIIAEFPDSEEGRDEAYKLEAKLVNPTLLRSKSVYNMALGGRGSVGLEDKKTVYMFTLTGQYIKSYDCAMDAVNDLNIKNLISAQHAIRNNCLETVPTALGYFWSYTKAFKNLNKVKVQVAQYTLSGKFIRYWDSITEAESSLNTSNIYQAIIKQGSTANYQWRYYENNNSDINPLVNVSNKNDVLPILMYDKNMKFLKEFQSVNDCINENSNLSSSQINRVLKGIIKSHKNYVFKYKR